MYLARRLISLAHPVEKKIYIARVCVQYIGHCPTQVRKSIHVHHQKWKQIDSIFSQWFREYLPLLDVVPAWNEEALICHPFLLYFSCISLLTIRAATTEAEQSDESNKKKEQKKIDRVRAPVETPRKVVGLPWKPVGRVWLKFQVVVRCAGKYIRS